MSLASSCGHPSKTAAPHTPGLAEADQALATLLRQLAQSGDEMAQIVLKKEAKTPEELRHHWLFTRSVNGPSSRYMEAQESLLKSHFGAKEDQKLEDLALHGEWELLARRIRVGEYEWNSETAMALLRADGSSPWVNSLREALFFWLGGATRDPEKKKLQSQVGTAVGNTFDEQLIVQFASFSDNSHQVDLWFVGKALENQKYDLATRLLAKADPKVNKRSPPHLQVDHNALRLGIIAQGPQRGPLFEWFFERTHDALPFRLPFDWAKPYYPAMVVFWDKSDEFTRAERYVCQIQHADQTDAKYLDPDPAGHLYLTKGSEERQHRWQKPIRQVDIRWADGKESRDPVKTLVLEEDSTVAIGRTFVQYGSGLLDLKDLKLQAKFMTGQRVRIVGRIARLTVLKKKQPIIVVKRIDDEI
jgi:hypothetical protein